ncbi:MAG: orotidine-5'-phosphate decarboxylase [Francisellaceae bacterium]
MPLSYSNSSHPVTRKLSRLVLEKQSNLCVSADITSATDLLTLAENVADEIVVLKTHIDIISDFNADLTNKLRKLADDAGFLLFEDRKFADIGNTVKHQVKDGIYHIAEWADIINAHLLPGTGIIDGLAEGCKGRDIGLLLLAQMSSQPNFFSESYTKETVRIAESHKDFVIGFIAQEKLSVDHDLITMTPGVKFSSESDGLGQSYNTPEQIIKQQQSDLIIVGRGIYGDSDPTEAAKTYRQAGWEALNSKVAGLSS